MRYMHRLDFQLIGEARHQLIKRPIVVGDIKYGSGFGARSVVRRTIVRSTGCGYCLAEGGMKSQEKHA